MIRDFDLFRRILFEIEKQYDPEKGKIFNLKIEGYEMPIIAEHCDLLWQQNLIKEFSSEMSQSGLAYFQIGNLTYEGYDYLELIRNEDIWKKTNEEIGEKKIPKTLEFIARIAGVFSGNLLKEFTDLS